MPKKVVFCIPTVTKPYQVCRDSLEASIPLIEKAGWEHYLVNEIGNPYISFARSLMLRKALEIAADAVVFIDHDLSWEPEDMLKLLETPGEVVSGTYRFKRPEEEYMGQVLPGIDGRPQVRDDGAIKMHCIPAGFLKITRGRIGRFMMNYPELMYVDEGTLTVDLFNHGAHNGIWYGEDYAFSRRWLEKCGDIWLIPTLKINHHTKEDEFRGCYHEYLLRQPCGSKAPKES